MIALGTAIFAFDVINYPRDSLAPLPIYALSLALLGWTVATTCRKGLTVAFTKDVPRHLVRNGPYRFIRHPFYVSYLLFWVASAIATTSLQPWLVLAVMSGLYFVAARTEERKFESSPLKNDYDRYRREVGMFLPGIASATRIWSHFLVTGSKVLRTEQSGGQNRRRADRRHGGRNTARLIAWIRLPRLFAPKHCEMHLGHRSSTLLSIPCPAQTCMIKRHGVSSPISRKRLPAPWRPICLLGYRC